VKTPDDGQRNRPKHVEFYSKNKFEKLGHLVGFIIRKLLYSERACDMAPDNAVRFVLADRKRILQNYREIKSA